MGLTSTVEAGVVLAASKMGLNPDDNGFLMLFVDMVGPTAAVDAGG